MTRRSTWRQFFYAFSKYINLPCMQLVSVKVNNLGSVLVQWQRQIEGELLLLISRRALGGNVSDLLSYFTFGAGDGSCNFAIDRPHSD